MPKALTEEDYQQRLDKKYPSRFKIIGDYTNAETKTKFKCLTCGSIINMTPHEIMRKGRCPICSRNKRITTTESFNQKLHSKWGDEYTLIEKYDPHKNKLLLKHSICGRTFKTYPSGLLHRGSACPYCKHNGLKLIPDNEFKDKITKIDPEYTPISSYKGSNHQVWFKHLKCGTKFHTTPNHFISEGVRCPYCTNKPKVSEEEFMSYVNSLKGEYIQLSRYKNSTTMIKFKHTKCNSEFTMKSWDFMHGERCPKCFGTPKHTQKWFEEKVKELVGNEYTVKGSYQGLNKKIRLIHNKCGNDYYVTPDGFINNGNRCPICSHHITLTQDEFKKRVNSIYGDEYTVIGDYLNNKTPVAVRHNICHKIFYPRPANFLRGSRCVYCYGNIKHTQKWFEKETAKVWGTEYEILASYKGLDSKVTVRHTKCGHLLFIRAKDFLHGNGCHYCSNYYGEKLIDRYLKKHNIFSPHPITFSNLKDRGNLSYDFELPNKVLIELQGVQHYKPTRFSSQQTDSDINERFKLQNRHDKIKRDYAVKHDFNLYCIPWYGKYHDPKVLYDKLDKIILDNNM